MRLSSLINFDFGTHKLSPFAMWTALPSSDYYGDSVTMSDIQRHLSCFSQLEIYHLTALRIDLAVVPI